MRGIRQGRGSLGSTIKSDSCGIVSQVILTTELGGITVLTGTVTLWTDGSGLVPTVNLIFLPHSFNNIFPKLISAPYFSRKSRPINISQSSGAMCRLSRNSLSCIINFVGWTIRHLILMSRPAAWSRVSRTVWGLVFSLLKTLSDKIVTWAPVSKIAFTCMPWITTSILTIRAVPN